MAPGFSYHPTREPQARSDRGPATRVARGGARERSRVRAVHCGDPRRLASSGPRDRPPRCAACATLRVATFATCFVFLASSIVPASAACPSAALRRRSRLPRLHSAVARFRSSSVFLVVGPLARDLTGFDPMERRGARLLLAIAQLLVLLVVHPLVLVLALSLNSGGSVSRWMLAVRAPPGQLLLLP